MKGEIVDYHIAIFILFLFVFLFGAVFASFLNVVIYRLPKNISVAKGRSYCPQCHKTLKPYDMIPVFSWFILGGKCRFCHGAIPFRYPLVEALGGLIAVLCFWQLGFTGYAVVAAVVGLVLLGIAFIDWDTMTIPDELIVALILLAFLNIFLNPHFSWVSAAIGGFAISLPMLILTMFLPGAFGGGDIKLMLVCGFILGWEQTLVSFFIALILGGCYGIILLRRNKNNRKIHFPFGPFLAIGIFTALLWGNEIIDWYLNFVF
ncbi:MAG: prepilin peptidase [Clostridiales bacterium]